MVIKTIPTEGISIWNFMDIVFEKNRKLDIYMLLKNKEIVRSLTSFDSPIKN